MPRDYATELDAWKKILARTCPKGKLFTMPMFRNQAMTSDATARNRLKVLEEAGVIEVAVPGAPGKAAIYKRVA